MELNFNKDNFIFTRTGKNVPRESLNQEAGKDKDTKFEKLVNLADEIFQNEVISYKTFCERHANQTGNGLAQAKRDHKSMKELEIIIKGADGKHWELSGTSDSTENPNIPIPDEPLPF